MLVSSRELMEKGRKNCYAIPAFNIQNLESVKAIAEAATEEMSPVIMQVSSSTLKYAGLEYITSLVKTAAQTATVPICMHLDHGEDYETVAACINAGFTSVMIDGSFLSFKKNVAVTKSVMVVAHAKGVSVEAELGKLAGIEEHNVAQRDAFLTDPSSAQEFVEETRVDSLAVAIGTSHGAYKFKGQSILDLDRLKDISGKISVPLVLHGASSVPAEMLEKAAKHGLILKGAVGVSESQLQEAIKLGVAKINIDTDLRLAFTVAVREVLATSLKEFDPRKILGPAKDAMKKVAKDKMLLFGSQGKA